jgi:hypothetical protein
MDGNNESMINGTQNFNVDPEQLKIIVGIIKKNLIELEKVKKRADDAWENCKLTLSENVTKSIEERKVSNDKKFITAKEQLEGYSNTLDSVSNIWKDTETEIMSSAKEFEQTISHINSDINRALGFELIKQVNQEESQNNTSNI